jgi:glycine betaine/choline ABC-type transport system substrate-binding protein
METLEKYPELEPLLEKLTGAITDAEMIAMNYEVEVKKMDYETVAKDFLLNKGLIK